MARLPYMMSRSAGVSQKRVPLSITVLGNTTIGFHQEKFSLKRISLPFTNTV